MIITTCETIPGKDLEYIGLVASAAISKVPSAVTRKSRAEQCDNLMAEVEAELIAAAQRKHADAVVGVRPMSQAQSNVTLVGTAVKFRL